MAACVAGLAGTMTTHAERQHVPEQPDANSPAAMQDMPSSDPPDTTPAMRIAEQALAMIREQIDRERDRADKAETEVVRLGASIAEAKTALSAALGRIEATEAARNQADERAHHLALELTAQKAMRSAADDDAAGLRQAGNERLQLGRWRRGWRGWRGR